MIDLCVQKLSPKGSICWQVGNFVQLTGKKSEIVPLDILLYDLFASRGMKLKNRIIWHFRHGLNASYRFSGRYEQILWFTKSDDYVFNLDKVRVPQIYPGKKHFKGKKKGEYSSNPLGKNPSDIWDIPNVKANHVEKTIHPCQFPISLVERLVLALSNNNDLILDPFLGVGTTSAAGIELDRRVAGAEINADYYKIAYERTQLAFDGRLIKRKDIPTYKPKPNTTLTINPFKK